MSDDFIGTVINGYEVLSLIGVGGMARVYLARQQSMNRHVALKVLPAQFASDDTYLQRFHREVKIVSQLEHAHIVPVYDYGEHQGQPYIVMRYMAGGSVDDLLEKGKIPLERIEKILSEIAPALDHAHAKGVLHRDLKPSNVLLDEAGSAFLSDFGIARLNEGHGMTITTQGVVGTPSYMSPEQAQGKDLDGRSDIYSLGVMLFELTTGRRPFEADTPYSIAVMHVTTPPPSPRAYNPDLTPQVERVILRALSKDPQERPARAVELVEALREAMRSANQQAPETRPHAAPPAPAVVYAPPQVPLASPRYVTPQPSYAAAPVYAPPMASAGYTGKLTSSNKKARPNHAWTGALIGGGIGCLFLAVVALIGLMIMSVLLPERPADTPAASTQLPLAAPPTQFDRPRLLLSSTPPPTLDATSEAARATLLARQTLAVTPTTPSAFPTTTSSGGASGSSNAAAAATIVTRSVTLDENLRRLGGTLVYADQREGYFHIVELDPAAARERQLTSGPHDNSYPTISPDREWIAFQSNRDGSFEIYVMNRRTGALHRLTQNAVTDRLPSWSPNSEWVIYASDVRGDGTFDILRTRRDGSITEVILTGSERQSHPRYSPDGLSIVFTTGSDPLDARTWEIARLDTQTGQITRLTNNAVRDASPVFSPDGTQILYITSLLEGTNAIALMDINGENQQIVLNDNQNNWAASFSPDGRSIVFTRAVASGQDQLYVLDMATGSIRQLASSGNSAHWVE
jgi:serine/threonine protein kinase/Tol biopolymer transport system component